ncbi:MAG: hypothetical protein WAL75_13930 [Terracidiphilus sp.]
MKTISTRQELTIRAAEALRAVLAEVSGTKVREISHPSLGAGSQGAFTASVDVYGNRHTLACEIASDVQPVHLRALLEGLRDNIERTDAAVTPVIIAQHISDEARAVCKENRAGFLDLEGNARIALGEVFILKRTIPHVARRSVINESVRPVAHHTAA